MKIEKLLILRFNFYFEKNWSFVSTSIYLILDEVGFNKNLITIRMGTYKYIGNLKITILKCIEIASRTK